MFSTKLTRAAHRAIVNTHTPSPTPSALSSASTCTTVHRPTTSRPSHQRRPSSSKASCPPDSSKPTPAAKGAAAVTATSAEESQAQSQATPKNVRKSKRGAYGPRTSKVAEVLMPGREREREGQTADQFARLPAVPGVQHLGDKDVGLSSFFSLHRPMSVTTTIPPPASIEAFNTIFDTRLTHDPWADGDSAQRRPEDVIYTLHNTIESLETKARANQDDGVRWEVIQESPTNADNGVKHLDGAPMPKIKSLEELVAQFTPFRPPPPPSPFASEQQQQQQKTTSTKRATTKASSRRPLAVPTTTQATGQKSYQTTITILETTAANGEQSYSASHTPIVQVTDPAQQTSLENGIRDPSSTEEVKQPRRTNFMQRRRAFLLSSHQQRAHLTSRAGSAIHRGRAIKHAPSTAGKGNVRMYAISVKRQRKLKMKKHKYKKLMKRTRNLRRRLDRN
ncbi:hypothetical protein LTR78_006711 [Recurvomyces mirabilis]|uniref:Small ribosomal subunit protein mS38 n=1 Tax=Recurvomyces mirabilis TaxID=574656 RepID=A0AAE1BZR8_9PEZI|nr:hypothetical protein LTR78_006711 [Recurvomyces mirabilis]